MEAAEKANNRDADLETIGKDANPVEKDNPGARVARDAVSDAVGAAAVSSVSREADKKANGHYRRSRNKTRVTIYFIKETIIMPGFDRSGPAGAGPMTGGRRGLCNPNTAASVPQGYGAGFGRGYGMGRGRRGGFGPRRDFGYYPAAAPAFTADATGGADGLRSLQNDVNELKAALARMEAIMGERTRQEET